MTRSANIARELWRRYWRALRLWARAQEAAMEHRIMYGDPGKQVPRGIINAGGLVVRQP